MSEETPVVVTASGKVSGLQLNGVQQFIEIPYGESTAGPNRFRPPQPRQPWDGVREATTWTRRAPQNPDEPICYTPRIWLALQGPYYAPGLSEDCLTVNVWTPHADDKVRPVLVWFHGGGYTHGHAGTAAWDGENFARRHDCVVVSVTHRLNAFGYLRVAELLGEGYEESGLVGLLDLIAALRWVQDNIAAFGGDPACVTIMGESGGGAKVSNLMVMPAATGLFHRAVCQSGVSLNAVTIDESVEYALQLMKVLGSDDPRVLLSVGMQELLTAQLQVQYSGALSGPRPVVDGKILPAQPVELLRQHAGSGVPLMAGVLHDEMTSLGATSDIEIDVPLPPWYERKELPAAARFAGTFARAEQMAGCNLDAAIAARRALSPSADDRDIALALMGDLMFGWPTVQVAELRDEASLTTFVYRIDWASPRMQTLGACHGASPALFLENTERVAFTRGLEDADRVSRYIGDSLDSFMRTGNCGQVWPPYRRSSRQVMLFNAPSRVEADPDGTVRDALNLIRPKGML